MKSVNRFMKWNMKKRAEWLAPFLAFLTKIGLTANGITLLRLIGGPLFVLLFPFHPFYAVIVILLANFADWFDGALARYQKNTSDRGKFWDVLVDHINYVLPVMALLMVKELVPLYIGYHLVIVPILYLLAIIKESETTKTDWIIHPYYTIIYFKPVAALSLLLYVVGIIRDPNLILLAMNLAMTFATVYFAVILIKRWSK